MSHTLRLIKPNWKLILSHIYLKNVGQLQIILGETEAHSHSPSTTPFLVAPMSAKNIDWLFIKAVPIVHMLFKY